MKDFLEMATQGNVTAEFVPCWSGDFYGGCELVEVYPTLFRQQVRSMYLRHYESYYGAFYTQVIETAIATGLKDTLIKAHLDGLE